MSIDLGHEIRGGHDGVRSILLDQGQTSTLGSGDSSHRVLGDAGQRILQGQQARGQLPEPVQTVLQVVQLRATADRAGSFASGAAGVGGVMSVGLSS